MRIIIADDSVLILERLQQMLSNHSRVELVGSFNNGIDTLDAIKTQNPDLVIADNKMPGLSGLEVLTAIRKEKMAFPFIMISFQSSDYYRQLAMEAGADYFLSKVDEFEKLELLVIELINNNEKFKS
jgi:DNA-binding NarL/FixJ family response regulator